MTMFVLVSYWDDGIGQVWGVFTTREKAEEIQRNGHHTSAEIVEAYVDQEWDGEP